MSWRKLYFYAAFLRSFSFKTLGALVLQAFGVLLLVTEICLTVFPEFVPPVREYWWTFLLFGAAVGLWRAWPRLVVQFEITGTDASIAIRVGDLFEQDGAVVVPAPTSFDTAINDGTIDVKSVQGQYTFQFCDSLENLNQQIAMALEGIEFTERDVADKPFGSRKKYPVGTIASVNCREKKAYLVAIATLNAHRIASATRNDLLDALPALWENIRTRGGMEPISVPVLGSGFSRLNAKRDELVREIVKSFVAATHAGRFCERLTIVISPKDFQERKINLESLGRFLEQECQYGNAMQPTNSGTSGTAV
ncbi:MAG: DUF6430 domain-containing protein [Gammaproteobacteria bacterium]|nr:DUF6430 domain-containing protein [Gammaproteobacteria bacterium]